MYPTLTLVSGKEANVAFRHPWVFSGALVDAPETLAQGDLVRVADKNGRVLGIGTFSRSTSIAVRIFEFGDATIDREWFVRKFKDADRRRGVLGFGPGTSTTGYRVVFGESDGVPGLVVDRYADVIVMQISTAGIDALRDAVVAALEDVFAPRAIVERSDLPGRKDEGLREASGVISGSQDGSVQFIENGLRFAADVLGGQKTGFFLDQRDLRRTVAPLCAGRRVLNLFSYTGALSIAALKAGAASVHNVDSSSAALAQCKSHAEMNGLDREAMTVEESDVFQYLNAHGDASFDVVVLDPPALIRSRKDAEEGKKAYHFLNRAAMRLVKDGGIFVTSSCSHYLPEEDLAFLLRRASVQNGVTLSVLGVVRQSADHPLSVYFPESAYLKSFICEVRRV
jgi:23S rRNA (cytosine1962-C5)-methyltransferase